MSSSLGSCAFHSAGYVFRLGRYDFRLAGLWFSFGRYVWIWVAVLFIRPAIFIWAAMFSSGRRYAFNLGRDEDGDEDDENGLSESKTA